MLIARHLTPHLHQLLSYFPIVSLTGPRQAGKTTLLRFLFPDFEYVSLENPDNRAFAQNDPNGFLDRYDNRTIFDEAQRVPELFSYLQTKVDLSEQKGQYILSGSQNFLLLQSINQSLAGRVGLLRLMPLTYTELKAANVHQSSWEETVYRGSYPRIYDDQIPSNIFYPNYVETYLRRDVNEFIKTEDMQQFERFLRLCAAFAGQLVNYSSMANQLGVRTATIKKWLSILESSYILFQVAPYHRNFSKRIVKSSKLYFYDTGLVCYLLDMQSATDVAYYYQKGALFENWVIAELHKLRWHSNQRPNYYFWQDSNKNEIDLLWETAQQLTILEVKASKTILPKHLKNLLKMKVQVENQIKGSYLVYGGESERVQQEIAIKNWKNLDTIS
ncbi:MAG: ATP-binding protein [Bacteroidota bacterium]